MRGLIQSITLKGRLRQAFVYAAVLAMFGCATTTPKPPADAQAQHLYVNHIAALANIQTFAIKGRIGIQTNPKGFSGSLQWQHSPDTDNIALYSPLGSQVAGISKNTSQITLIDAGGHSYSAESAEALTQMTLGWSLPLAGLSDWALGRPTKSPIKNKTLDAEGRLANLEQDGWKIEYSDYQSHDSYTLPGKIFLKSEQLNLKLLIEEWQQLKH